MAIRDQLTRKIEDYMQVLAQLNKLKSGLQYDKAFGLVGENKDEQLWLSMKEGTVALTDAGLRDSMDFQLNLRFHELVLKKNSGRKVTKADFLDYKHILEAFLKANSSQYFMALESILKSLEKIK